MGSSRSWETTARRYGKCECGGCLGPQIVSWSLSITLLFCLQLFCITAAKPHVCGGRQSNLDGWVDGSKCPWQGPPYLGLLWLEWLWRTPWSVCAGEQTVLTRLSCCLPSPCTQYHSCRGSHVLLGLGMSSGNKLTAHEPPSAR